MDGYAYYKVLGDNPTYEAYLRSVPEKSNQRIITNYDVNQFDISNNTRSWFIGGEPRQDLNLNSGYDIVVYVNAQPVTNFVYDTPRKGFIKFDNSFVLKTGDFISISADCPQGLISEQTVSKYELPLSWAHNPDKQDINYISQPEFDTHFTDYMQQQVGFTGEKFGSNNFNSTSREQKYANNIVSTASDLDLGALLLDDQPHNIIDALRFNATEYSKYKNRLLSEIEKYVTNDFDEDLNVENMLDDVVKRVISYKVGSDVFNRTYILTFITQKNFLLHLIKINLC